MNQLRFGPGLLVTAAFIGPGTIVTASRAGAGYRRDAAVGHPCSRWPPPLSSRTWRPAGASPAGARGSRGSRNNGTKTHAKPRPRSVSWWLLALKEQSPGGSVRDLSLSRDGPNKGSDQIGVESTTGAVAVGKGGSCCRWLSPIPVPHSSPWLRFQSPLIEPDMQISRIRLSDEIMPSPTESSPYAAQDA